MAIVTEFDANFNKFTAAVAGASLSLKSFTTDTDKVNTALSRMTDSFSGAKVIQQATLMVDAIERVGGASNLTTKELAQIAPTINEAVAKMQKMGLEVPANMQALATATKGVGAEMSLIGTVAQQIGPMIAGAFSVQALIGFSKSVLAAGDSIVKMSQQTGMTYAEVQKLQYVSGQTSVSMEAMVGAAQKVTEKLGAGDKGLAGALAAVNIKVEDLDKLDPYEKFTTMATAIGNVQDPTQRAAAAAAIFGKNWREIFPVLNEQIVTLGEQAPIMADKVVDATDRIGDSFDDLQRRVTAWGATAMSEIEQTAFGFGELLIRLQNWRTGFEDSTAQMKRFADENDPTGLKRAMEQIKPPTLAAADAFHGVKLSVDEVKAAEKELDEQAKASMEVNKIVTDTIKSYWDGVGKLFDRLTGVEATSAAQQWADALGLVQGSLVSLSQSDLKAADAAFEAAIQAMARTGQGSSELAGKYEAMQAQVRAALAQFTDVGPQLDQAMVDAERAAIEAANAETTYRQALYDAAVAEDNAALAAARKNAELKKTKDDAEAAEKAMRSMTYTMNSQYSTGDLNEQAARTGGSIAVDSYGNKYVYIPGVNAPPPHRAAGGPVTAGASYLVGERGPELFTPAASGMISPNGAGGVAVQNTFYLTDTESNLARRVSEAIMRSVTQARRV